MIYTDKILLSFFTFILFGMTMSAQDILPCATPPVKSEWLKKYQKSPQVYAKKGDTTLYVPISIHVLNNDNGNASFSTQKILSNFCQLNEDFAPSNIQFFIEGDINYINNTAWNSHDHITTGYEMMIMNNIPNTINCYIVSWAAGSGGYNLPSANAITLLKAAINEGSHTWAHEIGHNLSIQHPFLGWEGNIYSYGTSTPKEVYYDYTLFKETWNPDTIITDTAFVEYVARTNCHKAGDGFCDTPPDYLSSGWQCNSEGQSLQLQKDPDGVDFRSDGRNFMSYASEDCNRYFTPEQTEAMRANLIDKKSDYLYNQNPPDAITATPTPLYPLEDDVLTTDSQIQLKWEALPNATHYYYEVNRMSSFSSLFAITEGITTEAEIILEDIDFIVDNTYYWRILPFNGSYTCSDFSSTASFYIDNFINANYIEGVEQLEVYPNILSNGQNILFELTTHRPLSIQADIYDLNGQLVQPLFNQPVNGNFTTSIRPDDLSAGIYFVAIQANEDITYRKIVIK